MTQQYDNILQSSQGQPQQYQQQIQQPSQYQQSIMPLQQQVQLPQLSQQPQQQLQQQPLNPQQQLYGQPIPVAQNTTIIVNGMVQQFTPITCDDIVCACAPPKFQSCQKCLGGWTMMGAPGLQCGTCCGCYGCSRPDCCTVWCAGCGLSLLIPCCYGCPASHIVGSRMVQMETGEKVKKFLE